MQHLKARKFSKRRLELYGSSMKLRCCWLMQTTFKLIYGLPIKNKHLFVFLLFLLLTVLVFWRLLFLFFLFCFIFISNIFFFITVYLEKTICILLITYLLPKAIALQLQLPSPYNLIIKIELFYIYFFKDSGYRYRTAIFLNNSELLNTTCDQNQ